MRLLTTAAWLVCALPHVVVAATYYVSPTGNNGNTGTDTSQPWATIAYAEQTAANGSTVYLMNGTYAAVTIDRAGNSGRTGWGDAITFTPYAGHTPVIPQMTISGDYDRYLIFDGIDVNYPDLGQAIGTVNVLNVSSGGYLKFLNMDIHGALQRDADGEYSDLNCTADAVCLGNYAPPGVRNIYLSNCDIGYTGQIAVDVKGTATGEIVVEDCVMHDMGMDGIRHDRKGAICIYQRNNIYRQIHVWWNASKSGYHHGSGLAIFGDNCEFLNNRVRLAGTSAGIRGYQGAAGGGRDGGVQINGSYDDPQQVFKYGEEVVQQVTGATGKFEWMSGTGTVEIARATDDTTFDAVHDVVSSTNPSAIWHPTSLGRTRAWGGRTHTHIKNNVLYWASNQWYKMELYDMAPGSEVVNNTVIGSHVSANGWSYFQYALHNVPALYYAGNITDLKFCNNVFVGQVDAFPSGCTATGNVCYSYGGGKTQAELDAMFPGNKVYNWSPSVNTNVPLLTTSGTFFVGGSGFETYAFRQPFDSGDGFVVSGSPPDMGDCFALAEGSDAAGFGKAAHGTATDILGRLRNDPPSAGCYESQSDSQPSPPPDGPGDDGETDPPANAAPVLLSIGGKSTQENVRLAFSIAATDADGDPITYSATGLPSGASFSGQNFAWTPSYDQAGNHQVTFIASDGRAQDSETITIAVANVNRVPVLASIGDRSVDEESLLAFTVSGSDPDGDSLTYSANNLPAGATFSGGRFSWTPASAQVGSYDVTFVASDGQLQDTETITVVVTAASPDTAAPAVAQRSPEAGSIQVPLNNLVKLHVTDAGRGVDPTSVVIRVDGAIVYQGDTNVHSSAYGRCARSGAKNDYRFIYQANDTFGFDHAVTLRVDAADLAGNVMPTHSYVFTTEMRAFGGNRIVSDAADGTGPKSKPATVSDTAGNVWAIWHAGAEGSRDIYVAILPAGADAFNAPVRLTSGAADQCHPAIALGGDGQLYAVWQDNAGGNWDILLSVSADGTVWSRPVQVTDSDGNETNPGIVVDNGSPRRVHVVWQDDRNGQEDIYVAASANVFAESTVSRVTSNGADQSEPVIAVDVQNTVTVLWTDMRNGDADIYGAASNDAWANVPVVTASGSQASPAVAADLDASTLHMLWVDDRPGNCDIYYAQSDGLPASPVSGSSIIDDTTSADQVAPAIACVDGLRVFAFWQDMRHAAQHAGDSDLFMTDLGSGTAKTNVFVGDDATDTGQGEPAAGIDGYGNPYVVWTDDRGAQSEIYYAATTFIDPNPLDSKQVVASVGATVGTDPAAINSKDDVSIVVPAGACQFDARITISEILNPQALPVECLGSYDFGPSGIDFDSPVTVTIPYHFAGAGSSAKPYWYDSLTGALSQQGITDVENIVVASDLNALRFKTTHFTPFYLVAGDADVGDTTGGSAGGCSVSATASSSPKDLLVPYGMIAVVMLVLRRSDRRKRKVAGGSEN